MLYTNEGSYLIAPDKNTRAAIVLLCCRFLQMEKLTSPVNFLRVFIDVWKGYIFSDIDNGCCERCEPRMVLNLEISRAFSRPFTFEDSAECFKAATITSGLVEEFSLWFPE